MPKIEVVGDLHENGRLEQHNRVYDSDGLSPALFTAHGGDKSPKIEVVGDLHLKKISSGGIRNNHSNDVLGVDGISTCVMAAAGEGGGHVPKIDVSSISTYVKKRKFDVDRDALVSMLKDAKKESGLSNKNIAEALNRPITEVEHWFRTDSCGTIPDDAVWYDLKELLGIEDDSFDAQVCDFEIAKGVYERAQRCYGTDGLAPSLTIQPDVKIEVAGSLGEGYHANNTVYSTEGLAPTQRAESHGNGTMIEESGRGGGEPMIEITGHLGKPTQHYTVYSENGIAPTIAACDYKDPTKIEVKKEGS